MNHDQQPHAEPVAFTPDGKHLAEANYLGFITIRRADDGQVVTRYMAQTALVETIRFDPSNGNILMVGAGFEGRRDKGVVKVLSLFDGRRLGNLEGHKDDVTDVMPLPGKGRRFVSVGLDHLVIVHDLDDPSRTWVWDEYGDYLNTCSARPGHDGHLAVAGDSPHTYVLDATERRVVAMIKTPGDCNGLIWSADGRYLLVGDDHSLDQLRTSTPKGNGRLSAPPRSVVLPREWSRTRVFPDRVLVVPATTAASGVYPLPPGGGELRVAVDRRPGLWGINIAATANRLAVPSFFDRAYLLRRDDQGNGAEAVGPEPQPTFGCNWIAIHEPTGRIAVTHDDGRIRVRDAETGIAERHLRPDLARADDGRPASIRTCPTWPATIDFYGEKLIGRCPRRARRVSAKGHGLRSGHQCRIQPVWQVHGCRGLPLGRPRLRPWA